MAQADRRIGLKERSIQKLLSLNGRVTAITGMQRGTPQVFPELTMTGGGRGIGLSLARAAAELGSDVAVLDMLEKPHDDLWSITDDFGARVKYYR